MMSHDKERQVISESYVVKKSCLVLKFLQLKKHEIAPSHLILYMGLDFVNVFVRKISVRISQRPAVAEVQAAGHLSLALPLAHAGL